MKIEEFELNKLPEPLLHWFFGHARVLPWRENPTPYRVWVSEIMLQQTRVEAVKPYFERFIQTLPEVAYLAECQEEQLLKLWEGLGYYNRVRNMQIAAKQIMEEYHGQIPSEYDELLKLKGIGHYTAGAIASIAYGKEVPAVDGNVLRVISRVAADERDIMKQSVRSNMEKELLQVIPKGRAGAFNQALMELGATVCLPKNAPKCMECPWQEICLSRKEGKIAQIPVKSKAAKRRIEEKTVFLIRDGEKIILRKRPAKGLLAGMYEFPNEAGVYTTEEVLSYTKDLGLTPLRIESLAEAVHVFSHVEWHMKGYLVRVEAIEEDREGCLFVETSDFKENYPIPSAFAAYTEYLNIRQGKERFKKSE
ncbi:MAG: A/G-specific adenine glycosylase [Lachnospiraceae bacterium]|nr:A/G-specific adenine glycosylase [Lachnospiraceae bacterium]